MVFDFHLIFSDDGTTPRTTKHPPNLSRNEVAIRVKATIPDRVFAAVVPQATMEVPESAVLRPEVDMEVVVPGDGEEVD